MSLTAREAFAHIKHALSTDQLPTVGGLRILNDAGQLLVNMHSWRFLEGVQADLSLYPDQPHIWLPPSLREITALVATDSLNTAVTLTTPGELARRRASTINTSFHYWASLVWAARDTATSILCACNTNSMPDNRTEGIEVTDGSRTYKFVGGDKTGYFSDNTWEWLSAGTDQYLNSRRCTDLINSIGELSFYAEVVESAPERFTLIAKKTGEPDADYFSAVAVAGSAAIIVGSRVPGRTGGSPMPRLDIWPTPSSYEEKAFVAYFRRGWTEVRSDNDAVNIPDYCEPLYIALVRAVALGYERDSEADVNQRVAAIRAGYMFMDARTRDGLTQPVLGPLENGAVMHDYGINQAMWNFDNTGGPL